MRVGVTNFYVVLRNRRGQYASLSRAATYSIYQGKRKITKTTPFPLIRMKVAEKSAIISEKLRLFEGKKLLEDYQTEAKSLEKRLEQVKQKRGSKKKKVRLEAAKELSAIKDELHSLQTNIRDLEEMPEIPQFRVPRIRSKDLITKGVYSPTFNRDMDLKIYAIKHENVKIRLTELDAALDKLVQYYIQLLLPVFKKLKKNQRQMIFRLLYRVKFHGKMREMAAGMGRFRAKDEKTLVHFIKQSLRYAERRLYSGERSYFEKKFIPPVIAIEGFTFEYVDKFGEKLTEKEAIRREKAWRARQDKSKVRFMRKKRFKQKSKRK